MSTSSTYELLLRKYTPGECVVISEVSDTTGGRNRSLDHMVLNLWPSRGHSIIGIECKSWRGDWQRELKNPEKQEKHFRYCDRFYLLAENDKVVKDVSEIPDTWGYMLVKGDKIYTVKEAPRLTPDPIPKSFFMAMIRRAYDKTGYILKSSIKAEIEAEVKKSRDHREREFIRTQEDLNRFKAVVRELEKEAAITIQHERYSWNAIDPKQIGEAIRFLNDGSVDKQIKMLERHASELAGIQDRVNKALDLFKKNTGNDAAPEEMH